MPAKPITHNSARYLPIVFSLWLNRSAVVAQARFQERSIADHMKKVQTGDPLVVPAQAYNAFVDAAKDFQQRTRHVGQQATPGYRCAGIVLVKNESGEDRDRFDVLGLGERLHRELQRQAS